MRLSSGLHVRVEAGNLNAQFNLGICYNNGDGVTVDKREAIKWYKRAAEAGHVSAQYNLGNTYYDGDGVQKCDAEAGDVAAQFNFGNIFLNGDDIAVDKIEAIKWCHALARVN